MSCGQCPSRVGISSCTSRRAATCSSVNGRRVATIQSQSLSWSPAPRANDPWIHAPARSSPRMRRQWLEQLRQQFVEVGVRGPRHRAEGRRRHDSRVSELPPPRDLEAQVGELVAELTDRLGVRATVDLCVDLLEGADRDDYLDSLPYLTGLVFEEGSPTVDPKHWKDYWVRTWGARGLLYVWDDAAAPAVVAGLDDEHWRPAEMCLKVSTKRELGRGRLACGRAGGDRASCRECASRRCAPSVRSATPSTSTWCAACSTTRMPPYAARPRGLCPSSPGGSTSTSTSDVAVS